MPALQFEVPTRRKTMTTKVHHLVQLIVSGSTYSSLVQESLKGKRSFMLHLWPNTPSYCVAEATVLDLKRERLLSAGQYLAVFRTNNDLFMSKLMLKDGRGTARITARDSSWNNSSTEEFFIVALPASELFIIQSLKQWTTLMDFINFCSTEIIRGTDAFQIFAEIQNEKFWYDVSSVIRQKDHERLVSGQPNFCSLYSEGKKWLAYLRGEIAEAPDQEEFFANLSYAQRKMDTSLGLGTINLLLDNSFGGRDELYIASKRWMIFCNFKSLVFERDYKCTLQSNHEFQDLEISIFDELRRVVANMAEEWRQDSSPLQQNFTRKDLVDHIRNWLICVDLKGTTDEEQHARSLMLQAANRAL